MRPEFKYKIVFKYFIRPSLHRRITGIEFGVEHDNISEYLLEHDVDENARDVIGQAVRDINPEIYTMWKPNVKPT